MTAKQRKYFGKKKERPVAKRRRRSRRKSTAIVRRRRGTIVRRRGRSRRRHGGGSGGLLPSKSEMLQLAATGVYGFLETKAKADANFLLNKVPKLVPQLGYAGNVALVLRVANKFLFRNKYLELVANAAAHAFMYQVGREGGLPKDTNVFAISGDEDDHFLEGDGFLEGDELGALAAEGSVGHGPLHYDDAPEVHTVQGVPYMEPNPGT
jgi:hypothetical protein